MPHNHHDHQERKEKVAAGQTPPKGYVTVMVGQEGEEQQRFVVPVTHLNHPLFAELLDEAAREYGFSRQGAITFPCAVDHFRRVQDIIDRDDAAASDGFHHHHHHHREQHHHHHHHHHLPHFAGCFGA